MQNFWDKVYSCEHEWSPNYNPFIHCSTPMCNARERHCVKCGVYEYECQCGDLGYGFSGWPSKRWNNWIRKNRAKDTE